MWNYFAILNGFGTVARMQNCLSHLARSMSLPRFLTKQVAGVIFALDLCGILIFGLWPFGSPRNDVSWVAGQDAIRLGKRGTVLSSRPSADTGACTLEMLLRPALSDDSSTVLAFYGVQGPAGLSLHQSLTDLRVDNETGRTRPSARYVNNVFRAGHPVFLGIVTDAEGTVVYLDGALTKQFPGFRSAEPCTGSFVVGDSPTDNDTWQGEVRGLAIYRDNVSPMQIMLDYRSWTNQARPLESPRKPDLLYLFNEHSERLIQDHGTSRINLQVPERYVIVRQTLLEIPLRAFEPTRGYVEDLAINVLGFAPFGVTLYAFLFACGRRRYVGSTVVIAGLLTSLTIETLQSNLPTRDSDLTDVLTNTLGAWLGVYLISHVLRFWEGSVKRS